MATISIRLDDSLNHEFDQLCQKEGYKKSGLIIRLIRDFIHREKTASDLPTLKNLPAWEGKISLGGNALEDTERLFDE